MFRIARRVAKDRVISTVDPQARHGHKTSARGFDGYKGHVAVDPDTEIITATEVTAGNSGDAEAADRPARRPAARAHHATRDRGAMPERRGRPAGADRGERPARRSTATPPTAPGELLGQAGNRGRADRYKVPAAGRGRGRFPKDRFAIDLDAGTVTCPAGVTAPIRASGTERHAGTAGFGAACAACPLAAQCTNATGGRTITIGPHEARLAAARARQHDPAWKADYRATRPKVERKIGHLMRRRHGGRRARVRGTGQGRRRLRPAGRRGQPRPTRRARARPPRRNLDRARELSPRRTMPPLASASASPATGPHSPCPAAIPEPGSSPQAPNGRLARLPDATRSQPPPGSGQGEGRSTPAT